jgi:hypothetical protein
MSSPFDELTRMQQQTDRKLNDARDEFKRLLTTLTEELAEQARKLDRLKESDKRTTKGLASATRRLEEVERKAKSLNDLVESTRGEYVHLERRVRQIQSPRAKAQVDAWAAGQTDLGTRVAQGRAATHRMRDMSGEDQRNRIARHDNNVTTHRRHQQDAVEAARQLSMLPPAPARRRWRGPMAAWSVNHTAALRLAEELPTSEADKRRALKELDVMSRHSSELDTVVRDGEAADTELRQRIEDFVKGVVDADQFLPMWLELALGIGVSWKHPREWIRTAVGVIHYRIVYAVTDPVTALGDRPADREQRDIYDRLTADCAAYQL